MCRLPIDCVLAVTYKCNSRCIMCDIWKIKEFPEPGLSEFAKLPPSLRDVNLSGGEPFLRPDLVEIVEAVSRSCPKARVVISSNGFATGLILSQMKRIIQIKPDIGVAISIDGIGPMHDEMRGIPGGFDLAMATIKGLQALGMKNLRLGFTVTERNVRHLRKVYDLSKELGVQFTHSFAQSSDVYFGGKKNTDFQNISDEEVSEGMALGTEENLASDNPLRGMLREQYQYLIGAELKSWNIKKWLRAYYAYGMYNFISSHHPILSNAPGRDFFFMNPAGEIYPSVVHNVKMGDMHDVKDFNDFWCSEKTEEARKKTDDSKVPVWMICTARTAIKTHPFRVLSWIIRNKTGGFKMP